MIIIGIVAGLFGLGALCWLLFNLAVFALPLFAGVAAGLAALDAGASAVGAILVGTLTGTFTLVAGRLVFALAPSRLVRGVVASAFAVPASVAGYHAGLGLAALAAPAAPWRQTLAIGAALVIGSTAWARMSLKVAPTPPRPALAQTP